MCGRYTLRTSPDRIAEHFEIPPEEMPELKLRYNIAPTQEVPAVGPAAEGEGRGVALFRWGLVPHWARDPDDLPNMINARSETAHEKPAFRSAFARRRCLLPADGFYEWQKRPDGKQPYLIGLRDGDVFAFAGLWERWEGEIDGEERRVDSCTILTTDAAPELRKLHPRMPVILDPDDYGVWLDRSLTDGERLRHLLRPHDREGLAFHPVSRRVNSPRNDDPACVEPVEPPEDGDGAAE